MQKILLFCASVLYFSNFGFGQCSESQIKVKVEILTDEYGGETSWTLSDIEGSVVLGGGQGTGLENRRLYTDSICLADSACYVFEIIDSYGDGIFAPGGYKLFLNDTLLSSGADDIGSSDRVKVNCLAACGLVENALSDLKKHLDGESTLDPIELSKLRNIFEKLPECLPLREELIQESKQIIQLYETRIGALFTTPNTRNGFAKDPTRAPGLDLERVMVALQQSVFDQVFVPDVYALFPSLIEGWLFNSCYHFPGFVEGPLDSSAAKSVSIRANFSDPVGKNPYYNINGDGTDHALRPTGFYLAPGRIVRVTVPASLVGKGYFIRVGSHEWDLSIRDVYERFDRISKTFPIEATTLEVFNPFGGAISVLVPYGASEGIIEVIISNAVEAPFFSLKSFFETEDFNAELDKPGPWAVFETDNVMYTIPKHSIVPGQYDLKNTLVEWDKAIQAVNSILARQIVPDKHDMYMIADRTIRFHAYSIGYPMSNTPLDYTDVPGPAYFINGPGPDDEVNFHEHGHALAFSKFQGEEEALVNFPYIMALNHGLGEELNEAIKYSFVPNTFDLDRTATHRMVSNTFGTNRDISNTTTDEVRYQHRGYGHYFEMVNLFGWCPLRNFWRQEYLDFLNGVDHGLNEQDNDQRIIRLSYAARADLRPLFHVFGILSKDSSAVQDSLTRLGINPSSIIYQRMQDYLDLIPKDKQTFIDYARSVYPNLFTDGPLEDPNYGVGWHYLKSLSYDESEAQMRITQLQSIINRYFPEGRPEDQGPTDVCCLLDSMQLEVINDEVSITGGVAPYVITIDTVEQTQLIQVTDFDGCKSSLSLTLNQTNDLLSPEVVVFPNPATGEIHIAINQSQDEIIEKIQILSVEGQVLRSHKGSDQTISLAGLPQGMYVLQIKSVGGHCINKRIIIL